MARTVIRNNSKPTHEEIARRAYQIFEERGRPEGRDLEHWLEAEAQLSNESRKQAEGPVAGAIKQSPRVPSRSATAPQR